MEIFQLVFDLVESHIDRNGKKLTKKQEFYHCHDGSTSRIA